VWLLFVFRRCSVPNPVDYIPSWSSLSRNPWFWIWMPLAAYKKQVNIVSFRIHVCLSLYFHLLRSFLIVTWFSSTTTVPFAVFYFKSYDNFPFWYNCCKFQRVAIKIYVKCCRICMSVTVTCSHVTILTSAPFCMGLQQHSSQRAHKILRLDAKQIGTQKCLILDANCYCCWLIP
jgi:hypothetical protein